MAGSTTPPAHGIARGASSPKPFHSAQGANPRFVVTRLAGDAQALYDEVYCARGEMENRLKEQQLGLFADRTSCQSWWANQFRLLLSSAAYLLLETIRRPGLAGTELARAQVATIRLKVLFWQMLYFASPSFSKIGRSASAHFA